MVAPSVISIEYLQRHEIKIKLTRDKLVKAGLKLP